MNFIKNLDLGIRKGNLGERIDLNNVVKVPKVGMFQKIFEGTVLKTNISIFKMKDIEKNSRNLGFLRIRILGVIKITRLYLNFIENVILNLVEIININTVDFKADLVKNLIPV